MPNRPQRYTSGFTETPARPRTVPDAASAASNSGKRNKGTGCAKPQTPGGPASRQMRELGRSSQPSLRTFAEKPGGPDRDRLALRRGRQTTSAICVWGA